MENVKTIIPKNIYLVIESGDWGSKHFDNMEAFMLGYDAKKRFMEILKNLNEDIFDGAIFDEEMNVKPHYYHDNADPFNSHLFDSDWDDFMHYTISSKSNRDDYISVRIEPIDLK